MASGGDGDRVLGAIRPLFQGMKTAVVKRSVFERSKERLRAWTTVAGSRSNIAAVRIVWRVMAVWDAAGGPLPHTSPSATRHVFSPMARTS
jgi:hypothetical protein